MFHFYFYFSFPLPHAARILTFWAQACLFCLCVSVNVVWKIAAWGNYNIWNKLPAHHIVQCQCYLSSLNAQMPFRNIVRKPKIGEKHINVTYIIHQRRSEKERTKKKSGKEIEQTNSNTVLHLARHFGQTSKSVKEGSSGPTGMRVFCRRKIHIVPLNQIKAIRDTPIFRNKFCATFFLLVHQSLLLSFKFCLCLWISSFESLAIANNLIQRVHKREKKSDFYCK